jgi:hypothetical protein
MAPIAQILPFSTVSPQHMIVQQPFYGMQSINFSGFHNSGRGDKQSATFIMRCGLGPSDILLLAFIFHGPCRKRFPPVFQ